VKNPISYDAIVIGSGQGGTPLAIALAQKGWKTALIEAQHVGGTCVNEGCTPTKTMVSSARIAYLAKRASDYGVTITEMNINMQKIRQRKRDIVLSFRRGSEKKIEKTEGLKLYRGRARFSGHKIVEVRGNDGSQNLLNAEKLFINTGTRPAIPALKGLDSVPYLNSSTIMELDTVPEHLLIIGGGYIGLEFGQMFRRFGSRVSIIQRGLQLLAREDPDIAEEILQIFREDGIDVLLESNPIQVRRTKNQMIELTIGSQKEEQKLTGSHLLTAAGRVPNTEGLNADTAGVELNERGFIRVNELLETSVPGIYALGDVKGGPAFTHISYDDYRVLFANLIEGKTRTISRRQVPYTVFIDPQLGRIGMSEKEAKSRGLQYSTAEIPMKYVARALEVGETRGRIKVVVDRSTKLILGAAILGIEGGELMAVLQMAMMGNVPYTDIRDAVFSHPTLAESLNNLFMNLKK
jgi:pyruvate/2-oxoglutarate dehydrogenase complex dihydrolipoamide dehydrogenase (E3) component